MAAAEAHRASAAVIAERKRTTNFVLAVRFFYVESCRFSLAAGPSVSVICEFFKMTEWRKQHREKCEEKFFEKFFKKLAKTARFKRSI